MANDRLYDGQWGHDPNLCLDSITEGTSITDDLGADSLDVVDLVVAVNDKFNVEIPDDEVENIKTVGDLVKYIEDKM